MIYFDKGYTLSEEDRDWIERTVEQEIPRIQVRKKLEGVNYPEGKIKVMLELYDKLTKKVRKEDVRDLEDEKKFEENVRDYFTDKKSKMSWKEKRDVKRFLKNCEKYSKVINGAIKGFKMELEYIMRQDWDKEKINKEMISVKDAMIDNIVVSREANILDVWHPKTGEEVTRENLKDLTIDELIKLMEENVDELDMQVNGKITE